MSDKVLMWSVAVFILLPVGFLIAWRALRVAKRLKKYEFEHTTHGGVVQFETFEDSIKHRRRGVLAGWTLGCAVSLILVAFIIIVLSR